MSNPIEIKDMKSLLLSPRKGVDEEGLNNIAALVRAFLLDNNYTLVKWNKKVNAYITSTSGDKISAVKRTSDRNNLNQNLSKKVINWKLFKKFIAVVSHTPGYIVYSFEYMDYEYNNPPINEIRKNFNANTDDLRAVFTRVQHSILKSNISIWLVLVDKFLTAIYPPGIAMERMYSLNAKGNISKLLNVKKRTTFSMHSFLKMMAILGTTQVKMAIFVPITARVTIELELVFDINIKDFKET